MYPYYWIKYCLGEKWNLFENDQLSFQDDANKAGGKWIVRLKKGLASRCWENLVLAMLGEQFMVGEEICGAVISIRYQVSTETEERHGAKGRETGKGMEKLREGGVQKETAQAR